MAMPPKRDETRSLLPLAGQEGNAHQRIRCEWVIVKFGARRSLALDGFGIGQRPHTLANAWRNAVSTPVSTD